LPPGVSVRDSSPKLQAEADGFMLMLGLSSRAIGPRQQPEAAS
jgi:hypothetical protein